MDQQRVKDLAAKHGTQDMIAVIGTGDRFAAKLQAQTLTSGDPTYTGPLAGVSLGLPVYHFFDEEIEAASDSDAWDKVASRFTRYISPEALAETVAMIRENY